MPSGNFDGSDRHHFFWEMKMAENKRYTYESGRTGEAPVTGFAIRGGEIVIYLLAVTDVKQRYG